MISSSRARYLLRVERWLALPLHVALLILLIVTWWPPAPLAVAVVAGSGIAVGAFAAVVLRDRDWTGEQMVIVASFSFALDIVLATIAAIPSQPNPPLLHLLFAVLNVRAITLAPISLWPLGAALLYWPILVVGLWPWQSQSIPLTGAEALSLVGLSGISLGVAAFYREMVVEQQELRRDISVLQEKNDQQETVIRRTSDRLGRQLLALRALEEGTRAISDAVTEERALTLIAENCADVLNARAVLIGVRDNDGIEVMGEVSRAPEAVLRTATHLLEYVLNNNEPIERTPTDAMGGAFIGIPLRSEQLIVGAMAVVAQEQASFDDGDSARIEAFANQATLAIAQTHLYAQLADAKQQSDMRLAQLEAINAVARASVLSLDVAVILQQLQEQLDDVVPASHTAIYLLDRERSTLEPANQRVSGTTPPPVPVDADPAVNEAFQSTQPAVVILRPDHESNFQREFARKWGVEFYLVVPMITRDEPVGAIYLGSSVYDSGFAREDIQVVTSLATFGAAAIENVRLYSEVQAQSQQLEAVVRDIGDGVFVTDTDLHLLLINPKACEIFGLRAEPPAGVQLLDAISISDLATLCNNALQDEERRPQLGELSIRRGPTKRKEMYQALASVVVGEDDSPIGVVTVLRDITAQKELEQMKSNFVSVISHELRTPLHSIGGFIDIMLMEKAGSVNADQRDYLETVKDQTTYLNRLIEDLLEFNRLESGQIQLRLEEVEIGALLHEVVETLRPVAKKRRLQLINNVDRPFATITADKGRLRQVFTNLVDNALKFTSTNGSVTVSAGKDDTGVEIAVEDTGIGIPPEELNHVFERFYQVDTGHTRKYHGAGLGLAIVKHIVVQHGGAVWADSIVGQGSTFYVLLPTTPPETEPTVDFSRLLPRREDEQDEQQ